MHTSRKPLGRLLICMIILAGLTLPAIGLAHAQTAGIVIGTVEKLSTLDPADAGDVFTAKRARCSEDDSCQNARCNLRQNDVTDRLPLGGADCKGCMT